jgi:hypothetical protein
MTRRELVALMPGTGPADPPAGCHLLPAGGYVAALRPSRFLSLPGSADVLAAAAERARVLEALLAHGTVLPVLPGHRVTEAEAARLVTANEPVLAALARRLEDRAQFQVTVRWDRQGAAAAFGLSPGSEDALAVALRARIGERIAATGAELLALPVTDDVLANFALLVPRSGEPEVDAAVEDIDALWSDGFAIRVIGPYPAVSFASLSIRRAPAAEVRAARKALGLHEAVTEEAVKRARRGALLGSDASRQETLRTQADLLACVARLGGARGPVDVARVWTDGMATPATKARAA